MDKTPVYVKKILALLVVAVTGFLLNEIIRAVYVIPFCFLVLSVLIYRITGVKPLFLNGLTEADYFIRKKGGVWLLFKWAFMLIGLVYDIIVLIIDGIYQLFIIFTDILLLIKTIISWFVHAILWFLGLFVPPLVFLYKTGIHYLFKWPWWIYKLTYRNTGISIRKNFYRVSLPGAFLSLFLFSMFYGVSIFTNIQLFIIPGVIFALLPLAWSFGAIAYIRKYALMDEPFRQAKISFNGGYESIRAMLFYIILFLSFLLLQTLLNIMGWVPVIGFSLLGLTLNINTLLSIILLMLGVILIFANLILPAHVVFNKGQLTGLNETLKLLGGIGRRFLRYGLAILPTTIFAFFLSFIPILILALSIFVTISLRNNILDTRIETLRIREKVSNTEDKINVRKNIRLLEFYKSFPGNIIREFGSTRELMAEIKNLSENINRANDNYLYVVSEFNLVSDSLRNIINILSSSAGEEQVRPEIDRLEGILNTRETDFENWRNQYQEHIIKLSSDKEFTRTILYQLPLVYLFTAIWFSFFVGLVFTVFISYAGNVFYELYYFREDGRITFFNQTSSEIRKNDHNQPLLGFTLIFILVCVIAIIIL